MTIGRSFWKLTRYARAARFWLLLALAALAWLGFGQARAQSTAQCLTGSVGVEAHCENRSDAYQGAKAAVDRQPDPRWLSVIEEGYRNYFCNSTQCGIWFFRRGPINAAGTNITTVQAVRTWSPNSECPAGQVWNDRPGQTRCMTPCMERPATTFKPGAGSMVPNGSVGCVDGCQFFSNSNGDGTFSRNYINNDASNHCSVIPNQCNTNGPGYTLNTALGMCVPGQDECAANEVKDPTTGQCSQGCPAGMILSSHGICESERDQCPAGNIRSPEGSCLPGEGQCAAGEARKPDGTCGVDSDDDGVPDEHEEGDPESFSGGDSCNAPPSCNGDVIMCGIARINWRIECNTRNDTKVSGGSCAAVPICTGKNCDALEYAQLLQQWRSTCALEKLAENGIGGGDGEGDPPSCGAGMSDAQCAASLNNGDEGDPSGAFHETEYLENGFDVSGYGWGQSCPSIPAVTVFGTTLDFQSKLGPLCEWFQLGGIFLMIATGITCLTLLIKV